jgi:hypothetical protein
VSRQFQCCHGSFPVLVWQAAIKPKKYWNIIMLKLATLSLAIVLAGCATTPPPTMVRITYHSEPAGAAIYEGDRPLGYAPTTINYSITDASRSQGFMKIRPTRAIWSSGASATLSGNTNVDFSKGYVHQTKFIRPINSPGLAEDLRVAENLERLRQATAHASSQSQQAHATDYTGVNVLVEGLLGGINAAAQKRSEPLPPLPPPSPEKQKYRCRDAGFGNTECQQY